MTIDDLLQFQIDERYENEKGVFTVRSINKNGTMEIQWEDGERIHTGIDLQRSIQARRQMEQHFSETEVAQKARTAARTAAGSGHFDGFLPTDFKDSPTRTRWRGRDQVGGAVSKELAQDGESLLSWAVAQRPEIHWQDPSHAKHGAVNAPRFFAALNSRILTYGLRVSRESSEDGAARYWRTLVQWLQEPDNEQMLHTAAAEDALAVDLRGPSSVRQLTAVAGGWQVDGVASASPATLISANGPTAPTLVEITASLQKADALARGGDIAADIAAVFLRLMPVYRALAA